MRYFVVSFLLHWYLLSILNNDDPLGLGGNGGGSSVMNVDILEQSKDGFAGRRKCPNYYGGLGLQLGPSGEIVIVYRGYIGESLGLKTGDILITNDVIGQPGTPVFFQIRRDGVVLSFNTIRDKICSTGDNGVKHP